VLSIVSRVKKQSDKQRQTYLLLRAVQDWHRRPIGAAAAQQAAVISPRSTTASLYCPSRRDRSMVARFEKLLRSTLGAVPPQQFARDVATSSGDGKAVASLLFGKRRAPTSSLSRRAHSMRDGLTLRRDRSSGTAQRLECWWGAVVPTAVATAVALIVSIRLCKRMAFALRVAACRLVDAFSRSARRRRWCGNRTALVTVSFGSQQGAGGSASSTSSRWYAQTAQEAPNAKMQHRNV